MAIIATTFQKQRSMPAVSGVERRWKAKAEHLSPRYTTRLEELALVQA